jgi:taurine dioxygenase
MSGIEVRPLRDDLSFGARITGVTFDALKDQGIRDQIKATFEERGLIIFEDMEPSSYLQVEVSEVIGPLKEHPLGDVARAHTDLAPGVIELRHKPEDAAIVEVGGIRVSEWLPWHFDHCYNNELNRAGVLRAVQIPAELGFTRFTDGIQLYSDLSPHLREEIEDKNVLYSLDMRFDYMRFGKPKDLVEITKKKIIYDLLEKVNSLPRAIHPAVWTRETGEKVLHVSPWMALGLEGHEDEHGDALLSAVCDEMLAKMQVYEHQWRPTDMLAWDNWRLLHAVTGCDPKYSRCMHRTTIKGDYGHGYFENNGIGDKVLEMTV